MVIPGDSTARIELHRDEFPIMGVPDGFYSPMPNGRGVETAHLLPDGPGTPGGEGATAWYYALLCAQGAQGLPFSPDGGYSEK